jgi:hypothetical protein
LPQRSQRTPRKFKARKDKFVEWFDLDKIKLPLVVRFRKNGDRFWPIRISKLAKVTDETQKTIRLQITDATLQQ